VQAIANVSLITTNAWSPLLSDAFDAAFPEDIRDQDAG
jgi:hypothetical protein